MNIWSDTVLGRAMRRQIYADFIWCIDPGDRDYFRRSREAQLGMSLEQFSADRDVSMPALIEACAPLERTLAEQPFIAGPDAGLRRLRDLLGVPVGRIGSPRDVLADTTKMDATRAWRARMVALHGGLGDRFARYPTEIA